jgi:hypothetical protein
LQHSLPTQHTPLLQLALAHSSAIVQLPPFGFFN